MGTVLSILRTVLGTLGGGEEMVPWWLANGNGETCASLG